MGSRDTTGIGTGEHVLNSFNVAAEGKLGTCKEWMLPLAQKHSHDKETRRPGRVAEMRRCGHLFGV